jgi:hypothetical protein
MIESISNKITEQNNLITNYQTQFNDALNFGNKDKAKEILNEWTHELRNLEVMKHIYTEVNKELGK